MIQEVLQQSRPLRVLQVGCGSITGTWFKSSSQLPDIEYVGLMDVNLDAARALREAQNLDAPIFGDLQTALREVQPDAVFDCTIPQAHTPTALLAFEHGAHVLSEKPLSDTLENARRAVDAARANARVYAVTQNYRYADGPRRLAAFLASRIIGEVTTINADMYLGAHFGGFRDEMQHVLLLDMAIHTFDMARFLSNATPQTAFCHEFNPRGSWYRHGASAQAIFTMSDDVVFNFRGSWCATGLPSGFGSAWRIIGERGTVLWDSGEGFQVEVEDGDEGFFRPVRKVEVPNGDFGWKTRGHAGIMREFIDATRGLTTPETVSSDNIYSLAMVLASVRSAESGARVNVSI